MVHLQITWNTEYCSEFVIPYTGGKNMIPPNTNINTHTRPHTNTNTHTNAYTHKHTPTHAHSHNHTHIRIHTHTHTHTRTLTHPHTRKGYYNTLLLTCMVPYLRRPVSRSAVCTVVLYILQYNRLLHYQYTRNYSKTNVWSLGCVRHHYKYPYQEAIGQDSS